MDIESLRSALVAESQRPSRKGVSKKDILRRLYPEICAKYENDGWTAGDVVAWLSRYEIDISESTFRVYLHQLDKERGKVRKVEFDTNRIVSPENRRETKQHKAGSNRQQVSISLEQKPETKKPTMRTLPSAGGPRMQPEQNQSAQKVTNAAGPTPGIAPTLKELEQWASIVTEKVAIDSDIVVLDGEHVTYSDGRPFDKALSVRQVRLLRASGRLVATTNEEGRTSGAFVKMPNKL